MVEIYERVRGPESFLELLASYDLAGMLDEHRQDLERLFLKANAQAAPPQFASTKIQFEDPESEPPADPMDFPHSELNLSESECITGQILADPEEGTAPSKSFLKR
jgi:hypothetical protein